MAESACIKSIVSDDIETQMVRPGEREREREVTCAVQAKATGGLACARRSNQIAASTSTSSISSNKLSGWPERAKIRWTD